MLFTLFSNCRCCWLEVGTLIISIQGSKPGLAISQNFILILSEFALLMIESAASMLPAGVGLTSCCLMLLVALSACTAGVMITNLLRLLPNPAERFNLAGENPLNPGGQDSWTSSAQLTARCASERRSSLRQWQRERSSRDLC